MEKKPVPVFKFTPERLRQIEPPAAGAARNTYRDADGNGLELRVSSSGHRSFSYFGRVKGLRPVRVTLGKYTGKAGGMSIDAARRLAVEQTAAANRGENPAAAKRET